VRTAVRAAMEEARTSGTTSDATPARTPASAAPPAAGGVAKPALVTLDRTGLTTWPADLPELPEVLEAGSVRAYPSLVEEHGGTVAIRSLADESARPATAHKGLRRLLLLDVGLATPRITSRWTGTQALSLASSPYRSTEAMVADVQLAAIDRLIGDTREVRDATTYAALRSTVRSGLEDTVHAIVRDLVSVLTAERELDAEIRARSSLALLATAQDIRSQVQRLVHDGFVSEVGADRLPHLARYLKAARHRLVKAADNPQRDADLAWQVQDVEAAYDDAVERGRPVRDVRWQLEELRVSLFAQQLGTPAPVSTARIKKALAAAD